MFWFLLPAPLLQHTMLLIWFSEWTFVWGNTVSFGSWRAELTGPIPQQSRLEIKKQTKTTPSKKNAGKKPESSFSVLLKKLIYLATVLSSLIFVLLLKLRASLPLPVINVKFLPCLQLLHDCVQEGTGGREEVGFEAGANKAKKSCFSTRAGGIHYLHRKIQ